MVTKEQRSICPQFKWGTTVAYRADPQLFPKREQKAALLGEGVGGSRSERIEGAGLRVLLAHVLVYY